MQAPSDTAVSSPLMDTERALGVLLGQLALQSIISLPVTDIEMSNAQWTKAPFFAGGLRSLPPKKTFDDEKDELAAGTDAAGLY